MKISIGLFGFGRTGSVVANQIIMNSDCEIKMDFEGICQKQRGIRCHLLGYEYEEEKYLLHGVDFDHFFEENKVDVIIDFSTSSAVNTYKNSIQYGTRIVSAISNYDPKDIEHLKELSLQNSHLLFT